MPWTQELAASDTAAELQALESRRRFVRERLGSSRGAETHGFEELRCSARHHRGGERDGRASCAVDTGLDGLAGRPKRSRRVAACHDHSNRSSPGKHFLDPAWLPAEIFDNHHTSGGSLIDHQSAED
jgi:hypothetical protein